MIFNLRYILVVIIALFVEVQCSSQQICGEQGKRIFNQIGIGNGHLLRGKRNDDSKSESKRSEIRTQLMELLENEKDPKEVASIKFRLAENFYEEANSYFDQAQAQEDELAKDPNNNSLRAKVVAAKAALREQGDAWRLKAIETYREVAKTYRDFPGRDKVLFFLGASLWEAGRKRESMDAFRELINSYPESEYVFTSQQVFIEYFCEKSELDSEEMMELGGALEYFGRYYDAHGDKTKARDYLNHANKIYKKLGTRRKAEEVQYRLDEIE